MKFELPINPYFRKRKGAPPSEPETENQERERRRQLRALIARDRTRRKNKSVITFAKKPET